MKNFYYKNFQFRHEKLLKIITGLDCWKWIGLLNGAACQSTKFPESAMEFPDDSNFSHVFFRHFLVTYKKKKENMSSALNFSKIQRKKFEYWISSLREGATN